MRTLKIVDEAFEEMEVDDIIEEMGGELSDEDQTLSDDNDRKIKLGVAACGT